MHDKPGVIVIQLTGDPFRMRPRSRRPAPMATNCCSIRRTKLTAKRL